MAEQPFILLADDDMDDRELLAEAFLRVQSNLEIFSVSSGSAVPKYLENCPDDKLPSLIVLDYNMPDLTGAEVLQIVCKHNRFKNIPAVIWSTSDAELYRTISKQSGAKQYFQKPSTFEDMLKIAREMLAMDSSQASQAGVNA